MNRPLISLATALAAIIAVLGILVVLAEAKFRPVESPATMVIPADIGYLQGRVSEPKSWIPYLLHLVWSFLIGKIWINTWI